MSEPYAQLPQQLCFDHREAGELLNLLYWFKEVLVAAETDQGVDRLSRFIRLVQVRLGWDVDGMVADSDDPEEGYPDDHDD